MRRGRRAVVLGGSIGGLCASAAVAPYFDEVVALERDGLPQDADHRRGAPQSRHPHFLLDAGRQAIGELFPGVEDDLRAIGAKELNPARDAAYCEMRGWAARKSSQLSMLFCSRVGVERVLRERVRQIANVSITEQATVRGLVITDAAGPVVTGVTYAVAGEATEHTIASDLVIDAMGRGSRVHNWLQQSGVEPPPVLSLDAKVMYSSRWYQAPDPAQRPPDQWWHQMVVLPAPGAGKPEEHEYLCTIFPIENNRWIAFMGAWGHETPRTSEDFEQRAARLRTPAYAAALKTASPLSDVHVTRSTANTWRRYDKNTRLTPGIVFIGDSLCAFNPLYGQGMSAAAVTATVLKAELDGAGGLDEPFYRSFFTRQAQYLSIPWSTAVARDQSYDHAEGTEKMKSTVLRRISARITWPLFNLLSAAGREDPVIERHFSDVFNIHESVHDMLSSPDVVLRLARYWAKSALGRTSLPKPADPLGDPPAAVYQ